MFERQVTGLLTQLLGNYVEPSCFRHDKVNVGVWSGYVVLQHLELQRKTYAELGVAVVRGVLGSVTIKIPWNRLVYDSVLVTIDDVYVLLRHTERMDLVPPTEEMEHRIKQQLVEELYRAKLETEATPSADSFATRLRNKILDNLEFHIRRIHIRLEDKHSGEHPFAIGMTMESLHVQSTDAQWLPTYVDASTSKEPFIYKSVELNHLSIYLNPHCSLVSCNNDDALDPITCSIEEFTQAFGNSIPKRVDDNEPSQHHFLLKPVDASAHFKVKRDLADSSAPSMDIHVAIEQVSLQLEESQYCDLLFLFSALKTPQQALKYQKYLPYRPTEKVKMNPRGWWKYALRCVQGDNKEKRESWSWLYMESRRADRIEYMENWEALQLLDPAQEDLKMTNDRNEIQQALDAIERRRTVEDILLFRFMADQQLKKNSVVPRPQPTSGYGLWSIYRKYGWTTYDDQANRGDENTTSNLETQELYRILGYDPEEDKVVSSGCTVFSLQLTHGSMTFLNDPSSKPFRKHENYGSVYQPQPFFMILFSHLNMDVMAAPTSTSVDISLQTLEMFDEASEQLTFSHILKRRLPTSSLNVEITVKTPVFRMSYQTNAANLQNLKLVLEPLEIVYSPTALCWAHWSTFLQAPESLGHWAEIEVQALNELVNLKARTDAKVEYAMAHRLPMMIDVRVQAPVLIIPASDDDFQCSRLVMDLGHVHFRTERLSSLNVNDESIHTKRASVSTPMGLAASTTFSKQLTDEAESGEGATRWKEEFYDKFTLTMSNLHLMVLPPPVAYSPELLVQSQNTPYSIIDPFHINVTVRKSVLPLDATLYRLYVHADLPALAIHLSIPSYGHLTKVVNRFQSSQQVLEKHQSASAPPPLHPVPKPIVMENREVDNMSVQSDDTWFSVEYDSEENKKEASTQELNTIDSPKHQEPTPPAVPPVVPPPEILSEIRAVSTDMASVRRHPMLTLLDRRICVCTFTIPLIHINFVKGDEEDTDEYDYDGSGQGRLTFVLEGIKIRLAKRTLSTALKLRLTSIVLEDHTENLPTHFIAFSCAVAPNVPYTASIPRAKSKQYARRRSSAQLALLDHQPLLDLLDVSMTIEENAPMNVDVVFGHFHVHFDQSRLASLVLQVLPLFQGNVADHEGHEATDEANYPPSFNLDQITLTEPVRQDLERAAHHRFVHETVAPKPQEASPMQLKIQLHSISVCFSDPIEHLLSMAVLDVKIEMVKTKDGSANVDGRIGNVKILDLISPDLKHIKKKDKRYVYQEVLGKAPLDSPSSNSALVSCHLSSSTTDTCELKIHVNKLRTVIPTRFVLKFLHYVCDGPLMEILSSSSSPAPPPPPTSRHRRRDVFFSPALTYRDMAKQQHIASRNAERMPWTVKITMTKPYIVLPMVEPSADDEMTPPMVHLQHGLILELGDIEICVTKEKTITTLAYTTKEMHVRGLQDDFAIVQPFNFTLEMACTSVFNISARLSMVHIQISEMHAALCLEWYFQCLFPIVRYLTPTSPPPPAPMPTLALDVACDGLSLSLHTCRGKDDPMELDIYPRVAVDTTLVVHGQLCRVDVQISTSPNRSQIILSVQDVQVQHTTIHPQLRVEYTAVPARKDVSILSKTWYIDVNPDLVVDSVVVCMGIMFNLQATLARHYQAQQQTVPMESSLLAADLLSSDGMTSEYQWTERGGRSRADSFASSMLFDAMTTTTSLPDPIPIITHQEATWNVQVAFDTIQFQLGQLIIQCQLQASSNTEMLQCRLSRFKWLLSDSTLVEPMDITFSHNLSDNTLIDVSKFHEHFPDEIVTSSLHLTPLLFRLHVKDLNGFHNAIDLAYSLSNNLNSIATKHKPPTELKDPELTSNLYGDDVLVDASASERWRQVRVEFSSMEFELTEMAPLLSSHFDPAPFTFIQTPIVTLCRWECAMEMWYYNTRLLAREPLLEPFELSCEMMKVKETPINVNINGNELKVNCTAALLDVIHFWNQLSQPSAFDMSSGYLRNNTGLPIRIFGTQIVPSGLAVPLSEAAAGATPVPSSIHSTVPVGLDGYVTVAIPLGECGVRSYRFHPVSSNLPPLECTVEISLKQGCKWVILQSGWILENKTNSSLNIQLLFPSSGLLLSSPHTCLLHPMETYAVPLPLVGGRTTQMFIQPPNTIQWTLVEEGAVQCSADFYVYVVNTPTPFGRSLSFCPPLIIHNALAVDMEFKLTSSASSVMALTHESGKIPIGTKLIWHGSSRQDVALQIRMQGFAWSAPAFLGGSTVVSMSDLNNHSLLYVHLDIDTDHVDHLEVTVYTPYWILNQTGLDLEFTHEEASLGAEHPAALLAGQPKVHKASNDQTKNHTTSVVLVSQPPVLEGTAKLLPQRKPHHQILPSIPPSKGLLDLIPNTQRAPKRAQTLLQACHTNQSQQTLKLQCRVRKKDRLTWSSIMNTGLSSSTDSVCTIPDGTTDKTFVIGYGLSHGQGFYERTQILTLMPRFLLVNALEEWALDILADEASGASVCLEKQSEMPWHCPPTAQTLRIRFNGSGWVWSGAFSLNATGDQTLRLRNTQTRTSYLLRVSIKLEGPQYRIVFRSSTNAPPYRIENFSLETIRIHQSRVRISEILLPHQTLEYTWDEPLKPRLLIVDLLPSQADDNSRPIRIGLFSMEELQSSFPTKVLSVQVLADGPTRVLRLTDLLTPSPVVALRPTATKDDGLLQYVPFPKATVKVRLQSIGISVVDASPVELLYMYLENVQLGALSSTKNEQLAMQLTVETMQLDNQMRTTRYPVLLQCTDASPSMQITIVRETTYTSIEFLRFVGIHVSPMRWRIDGSLLNALATMFFTNHDTTTDSNENALIATDTIETRLQDFTESTKGILFEDKVSLGEKKLYFEKFEISPIHVTLSFASSPTTLNSAQVHTIASVRQIIQAASKTLTKVHNAPLVWRALRWQHMFVPRETMLHQMSLHYQHEALRQAYVLLGSVDVLGNPVKVWHNLKGGLSSFVWEPLRGWRDFGAQGIGWGLLRGTTLLFRALVYAMLDFNTRIASSCTLGLTEACQHIDTYSGYPLAKNLYQGLAQSVSGVVVSPMHSYQKQGWRGFFPGLVAGLLGLVLKPCRGFAQAFVDTTTTLRDGLQYDIQAHVSRTRPPRYIHPRTHLLTTFSYLHASGEDIKYNIEHARQEDYVGHVMLIESRKCILVTKHRIMCLQVHWNASLLNPYSVVWEVLSDDLILVSYGIPILLYYKPQSSDDWSTMGLSIRVQKIDVPSKQAAFVYSMLQQVTPTIFNQVDYEGSRRQYPLFVNQIK